MTTIVIVLFALFIITTIALGVVNHYYDVDAMMAAREAEREALAAQS